MLKAFIFDIDGTLIDSNDAHAESFVAAFEKFGKSVKFEELKPLIGMGADKVLKKFLSESEIKDFGEDLKEYRKEIFLKDFLPQIKIYPKLCELFEKIRRDGKRIVLASSASDKELKKYKEKLNISDLLEDETSSDDAEESKPDPDIFQAALDKLKSVKNDEVLIVGDTPYDAEAAMKADLKIIGVESGGWSRAKLSEKGCVQVFRDIAEICDDYEKVKNL